MPALTANLEKSFIRRSSDNLGTVRDLAEYDSATDTTAIVDHYVYDAFGNETDHTGSNDFLFKYTGRAFDDETGLQNNLNRWYDPTVGRWLSEDPIGFEAGDANVYRYVGNFATGATDPSGLAPPIAREFFLYVSRGQLGSALTLLGAVGGRHASNAGAALSAFLNKVYSMFPAASQRCTFAADWTMKIFAELGKRPRLLNIIDGNKATFWFYKGQKMTSVGWHKAVYCQGRIYDALTGSTGMTPQQYVDFLRKHLLIDPVITGLPTSVLDKLK